MQIKKPRSWIYIILPLIMLLALPLQAAGQEDTGTVTSTGIGGSSPRIEISGREYRVSSSVEIVSADSPDTSLPFQSVTPGAEIHFVSTPGDRDARVITHITILEYGRRER